MNIFVDANIPQKIASRLREEGHSVQYVDRNAEDTAIIEAAYQNKALLNTQDKDFERLVLDELRPTSGVILLRISKRIPIEHRAQILVNMLRKHKDKLQGTCASLTETYIDIRRQPR